jgi:alkylhydroperoxidase family enzyme
MATVKLWTDAEAEAHPKVKAVFDDIRATRKSDFVNNFWRGLANQPESLERVWNTLKAVMNTGAVRHWRRARASRSANSHRQKGRPPGRPHRKPWHLNY